MLRSHIAAVAAAAALALTGCGDGDGPASEQPSSDLTAIKCPVAKTTDARGDERHPPADNAFDTAVLVGKPLDEARAVATRHGCVIEIAKQDGRGLAVPIDYAPERIYVFVEHGDVSYIEGVGGGI